MFELIEAHLKKIGRNGLLPAGIIITGGGSGVHSIDDMARIALKLPSRIGSISETGTKTSFKDGTWAVAYGLCIWGNHTNDGTEIDGTKIFFTNLWKAITRWLKQFLP